MRARTLTPLDRRRAVLPLYRPLVRSKFVASLVVVVCLAAVVGLTGCADVELAIDRQRCQDGDRAPNAIQCAAYQRGGTLFSSWGR